MKINVAIIGGGPAGISTAIQLGRYGIGAILFEQEKIGGLIKNAYRIENYPGFPDGISGTELTKLFEKHVKSAKVDIRFEKVLKLEYEKSRKNFVITTGKSVYYSYIVVVASGTKPNDLNILDSLSERIKHRIFFEIYPIVREKEKRILIVGTGDIAFDYALNLAKYNEIFIINRGNHIKALPILQERVKKVGNIHYFNHSTLKTIREGHKGQLFVMFGDRNKHNKLEIDYLIFAIGRLPQRDFYMPELLEIEEELISRGVLYLVGDVKNGIYRQIAISVGNGIEAAMRIGQKIES